jgi:hypothetical protein
VRILLEESNNAKLRKKENRGEKGFKIFVNFIRVSDNILSIFSLKMFYVSRFPATRSLASIV